MEYILTFIEGVLTFISPCMLPMVPIYITYLVGKNTKKELLSLNKETENSQDIDEGNKTNNKQSCFSLKNKTNGLVVNSIFFVLGFTIIFVLLGVFSSTLGRFFVRYKTYINIFFGFILIFLGINYMGILNINFLNRTKKINLDINKIRKRGSYLLGSFLFGVIFAVGWSPCIGTFLTSALIRASARETVMQGAFMLFLYSFGLGLPFVLSSIFIDCLKSVFQKIKKHYKIIDIVSGIILIILGLLKILNIF